MSDRAGQEPIIVKDKRRFDADGRPRPDTDAEPEIEPTETVESPNEAELEALESARDQVRELESQLDEIRSAFRRYKEEQQAIRSRMERDRQARVDEDVGRVLLGVLSALDDLERALAYAEDGPLAEGVRLVHQQLLDTMAQEGLEPLDLVGKTFDPHLAEAVELAPAESPELENVVLSEIRSGYRFRDRILRPAQVRVGMKMS
ncbi:MAG: nucleotide exchange factor GrpE [Acidobacteriota bacterium]|nr:MAG: nucleotide exchange factor GrpE [Acidobacteriota bacterium]